MEKIDKIKEKIINGDFTIPEKEIIEIEFILKGKPINYTRERSGRNHFYNPKEKQMLEAKSKLKSQLNNNTINISDNYYVELYLDYYIPIQRNESIKNSVLKELGIIRPDSRPDIDNYDKFIIDALHEVLYDDDCKVVKTVSEKFYSLEPKTVIRTKIIKIKS